MIIDILIDNKKEKCFIFSHGNKNLNHIKTKNLKLPTRVNFSSIIKTDENEEYFIKVIPPKYNKHNKFKFFLRHIIAERLLFNAKAIKEYRYSKKLAAIGINTPKVYAGGFFLSSAYKYSGIVIYEKLNNLVTAQEILLTEQCEKTKEQLLHNIQLDYKKMTKKRVHFRDFHMSNVLVEPETLKLYWIDPALSKLTFF